MGFGLKLTEPILEHGKEDWVNYNGVYMSKQQRAGKRAWETRTKNEGKKHMVQEKKRKLF